MGHELIGPELHVLCIVSTVGLGKRRVGLMHEGRKPVCRVLTTWKGVCDKTNSAACVCTPEASPRQLNTARHNKLAPPPSLPSGLASSAALSLALFIFLEINTIYRQHE